jgi:hypothetical protein
MVTTLGNMSVGQILTAADMNAIATYSAFTVTTTGSANMTFVGVSCVINKVCIFEIIGTSTGAATPPVTITLPESMATLNSAVGFQMGFFDDSANVWYYGPAQRNSGTAVRSTVWNTAGTYLTSTAVTNLIPFTWAVNDLLVLTGTFRIA